MSPMKKMYLAVHITHLLKMVVDIHTASHEVMAVVMVEVPMALLVIMDITLISLVVEIMVIMLHQ